MADILPHYEVTGDGPGKTGQFGARATDLGFMTKTNHGWCFALFGDTFVDHVSGTQWRSPTAFRTHNPDIANGIKWDNAIGGSYARQIIDYQHNGTKEAGELPDGFTNIPNDMIHFDNGMYLMSTFAIKSWLNNSPGKSWQTFHSRLWVSTETNGEVWGRSWDAEGRHENFDYPNVGVWSHFQNVSFLKYNNEPWLYVYGTNEGRWLGGGIHLMRVPWDQWNIRSAYRFWGIHNGDWGWWPDTANASTPILLPTAGIDAGRIGEINAQMIDGNVVLTYWDSNLGAVSVASHRPEGWWSDPKIHATPLTTPAGYAPCLHPYSTMGRAEMLISQWYEQPLLGTYYGTKQYHVDLNTAIPNVASNMRSLRAATDQFEPGKNEFIGSMSMNLNALSVPDRAAVLADASDVFTKEEIQELLTNSQEQADFRNKYGTESQ